MRSYSDSSNDGGSQLFDKFDASLGTLSSVVWQITYESTVEARTLGACTITLGYICSTDALADVDLSYNHRIVRDNDNSRVPILQMTDETRRIEADVDYSGQALTCLLSSLFVDPACETITTSSFAPTTIRNDEDLGYYIYSGLGTPSPFFDQISSLISVELDTTLDAGCSAALVAICSVASYVESDFTLRTRLIYEYDPAIEPNVVPLPAGFILLLSAAGGLAMIRRSARRT